MTVGPSGTARSSSSPEATDLLDAHLFGPRHDEETRQGLDRVRTVLAPFMRDGPRTHT